MGGYYSDLRVDIPIQPQLRNPEDLSYELNRLLGAARALHLATVDAYGKSSLSAADIVSATLLEFYLLGDRSKFLVTAGANIAANRVVGIYESGGLIYAKQYTSDITQAHSNAAGVSSAAVASGERFFLPTTNAVVGGFSGLTPGTFYYAGETGVLITDPSIQPTHPSGDIFYSVGMAVSSTQLKIKIEGL